MSSINIICTLKLNKTTKEEIQYRINMGEEMQNIIDDLGFSINLI